jgi:hypothetical protein
MSILRWINGGGEAARACGKALEIISGLVTAPGGTLTPLTMAAGNSATVRNASLQTRVALLQTWATNQGAGIWRIRSPKLHDNVQGIRMRSPVGINLPQLTPGTWQRLWPQDNLTLELSGSAVGGDIEQAALMIYYEDLPGSQSHLITVAELLQRTVNVWTTEVPITPGAGGNFSGQVSINSTFDNFKANTDYALVGYEVDVLCHAVRFSGPDFANLGVGGPGTVAVRHITDRWFYHLSQQLGLPLIPVFNSANKNSTTVDIAQNENASAVNVTAVLYELAPVSQPQLAQPALA